MILPFQKEDHTQQQCEFRQLESQLGRQSSPFQAVKAGSGGLVVAGSKIWKPFSAVYLETYKQVPLRNGD